MVTDPCQTPEVICNQAYLQSPDMQKYLLIQLLCAAADGLGASVTCTDAALKAAGESWACQGSPAQIRLQEAQMIVADLADVRTSQPVCWTPLELEGAVAYLICKILTALAGPS